jgi:hypothetical protein
MYGSHFLKFPIVHSKVTKTLAIAPDYNGTAFQVLIGGCGCSPAVTLI